MAFTHIQGKATAFTTATTVSAVLNSPILAGDMLVAELKAPDITTTVSDSASNVWTVTAFSNGQAFAYCLNASASSTLTVTATGTSGARCIVVDQFRPQGQPQLLAILPYSSAASSASGNMGIINGDPGSNLIYGGGNSTTASVTYTAGKSNNVSATIGAQASGASGSVFSEYVLSTVAGQQSLTWTCSPSAATNGGYMALLQDVYSPSLSAGGMRAFTFADVIASLQQDVENVTQVQIVDNAFTLLLPIADNGVATEGAITLTTSGTTATWGSFVWGFFTWG